MSFNTQFKVGDNVTYKGTGKNPDKSWGWGLYVGHTYEVSEILKNLDFVGVVLKGLIPCFNSTYFKLAEENKDMSDKKFKKGDKVKRIYGDSSGAMKLNGEYVVSEYNGFDIKVEGINPWFKASYFKLVEESPKFIERDGKYNLEVTGEDLVLLKLIIGKTNGSFLTSLFKNIKNSLGDINSEIPHLDINIIDLNTKEVQLKQILTKVFTPPETEQQRKLRELEEQYKALGEKIDSLKEGN